MSLALIEESAKEVRRLAVAGSPLAVGDFRLKKLVAPLEQAGAKVPVFAQVAKAISELIGGTEKESAARLLNLSTLLNAILYTQGNSTAEGDFRELEAFETKCSVTKTTSRVLRPLVEALTSSGAGRFETIKSASERGALNDLRLIDPAIQALGDNYPELADLIAEKVLPAYGPGIIPRLKSGFDLKGKKHDARKLAVMHQLDPAGMIELCKAALDDGSPEVKAAAIACLGKHEECIPLVLAQTKAKNKELRAAALGALAEHDRPEVVKLFTELIKGKGLDILVAPFRAVKNKLVLNSLLSEGRQSLAQVVKGESEQLQQLSEIFDCLELRKEPEIAEFLLEALANTEKLCKVKAAKNSALSGADLAARLAGMIYRIATPEALDALLAKRDALPAEAFSEVLSCAARAWPADKFFDEFSPLLSQKKGAAADKSHTLQNFLSTALWDEDYAHDPLDYLEPDEQDREALRKIQWDPRWLDAALAAKEEILICSLARPNHKGVLDFLLKAGQSKMVTTRGMLVKALTRCQYPKVTDFFLEMIEKKTKSGKQADYEFQYLVRDARFLPPADLPKLEAFASKLDGKYVDHFLEAIAPLRPAPAAQPAN